MAAGLDETIARLAAFEPSPFPVISLYLNAEPDHQRGEDSYVRFVRAQLPARAKIFAAGSDERRSFERDCERIKRYLAEEVKASTNGVAVFACDGHDGFFEAIQFEAPIRRNRLIVGSQPNLFPLAWLSDRYDRYAVVVADSSNARVFLFSLGALVESETLKNKKISRSKVGGWSQGRYQRRMKNLQSKHAEEIVEVLERLVREEKVDKILFSGDEVIVPTFRAEASAALRERVVEMASLDLRAPEKVVFERSLEALGEHDAAEDRERVRQFTDEFRAGGLAVAGVRDTLDALLGARAEELLLSAPMTAIAESEENAAINEDFAARLGQDLSDADGAARRRRISDALVTQAEKTGAEVRFIEDTALLESVGGVGAFLRY